MVASWEQEPWSEIANIFSGVGAPLLQVRRFQQQFLNQTFLSPGGRLKQHRSAS
jgi:hypothetical protein